MTCDYCQVELAETHYMRAIGFTELNGKNVPLIRVWCGFCTPDDEVNLIARAMIATLNNGE